MSQEFMTFIVGALAGVITGLGALAAYYAATRQNRLTATSIAADWLRDLRAWASEAVDVLAKSTYTVRKSDLTLSASEQEIVTHCRL